MPSLKISSLLILAVLTGYSTVLAQGQLWGVTRLGGSSGGGVIFKTNADGTSLHSIVKELDVDVDGQDPRYGPTQSFNGKFYGVTIRGGRYNMGVLYEFDPADNSISNKADFDVLPTGELLNATNGRLYGLAMNSKYQGIIFEFDPATDLFRKVAFLEETVYNYNGGLTQASNGKIYGTLTGSLIFEFNPATFTVSVKTSGLELGMFSNSPLVEASPGILYGTSSHLSNNEKHGYLFDYNIEAQTYTIRHAFTPGTGINPVGNLAQAPNGKLYGLANGIDNPLIPQEDVALYEFDPDTKEYSVKKTFPGLYGFIQRTGLEVSGDGKLYGKLALSERSVRLFSYDPVTEEAEDLYTIDIKDGTGSFGNLTLGNDGQLYGTCTSGGSYGMGTIFTFDPTTHAFSKKIDFGTSLSGAFPFGKLTLASNGKIYGMTSAGGLYGLGTIFELNPADGSYTIKHHFDGPNGATPLGGLTLAGNGKLYGMTTFGGTAAEKIILPEITESRDVIYANGLGVIFEFDPATGDFTKLRNFDNATGSNPYGNLMQASNGKFYGMTSEGGANGGVLFEYELNGSYAVKENFPAAQIPSYYNRGPKGDLVEINGKLYGVTTIDGDNERGTIFELDLSTGVYTKKIDFTSLPDGPVATGFGSLTVASNGKIYGIGFWGLYFIFEYDLANNVLIRKSTLQVSTGYIASASLTPSANGKLYATTLYSTNDCVTLESCENYQGSVLEIDPASNSVKTKFNFTYSNGALPGNGALLLLPDKMEQVFTLEPSTFKVYGDAPYTLPEFTSAGLPISYSSNNPSVATVAGNVVTIRGAGSAIITGTQAGDVNYNAAPAAFHQLTVEKATQSIFFAAEQVKKVSDRFMYLNASASSGLPVTLVSSNPAVVSIEGSVATLHSIGQVTITAKQNGNQNFLPATDQFSLLEILPGDQWIDFPEFDKQTYGVPNIHINASATSGLPVEFKSLNTNVATISENIITIKGAGSATIVATQAGNLNYRSASEVARVLVVDKANQTITLPPLPDQVLGSPPFRWDATTTSSLPVVLTCASDKVSIKGNEITLLGAGPIIMRASQPGDNNYNAATDVYYSFCINPPKPSITTEGLILTSSSNNTNEWFKDKVFTDYGKTFQVTMSGEYQVRAFADGCVSEMSDVKTIKVLVTDAQTEHTNFVIQLYPNPVHNVLFLTIPRNTAARIIVGNLNGNILRTEEVFDENFEMSVEDFPTGIYWISIRIAEGVAVAKFVKK